MGLLSWLVLGLFALWYVALKKRLVSRETMRKWFFLTNMVTVMPASALVYVVDAFRFIGVPRYYTERTAIFPLCMGFRAVWWLNPQITFRMINDDGQPNLDYLVPHNSAVVGNHCSFWDVYCFIHGFPMKYMLNTRTLMKSTLREIPIFGGTFDRVGHFPVYFKSDEDGNFQVDKEKQAVVQVKVEEHLKHGGNLALFPEGAMNRNPPVLQPFRFGTLSTIIDHRMPVYYAVVVGCDKTWPRKEACGGYPADLVARFGTYKVDYDKVDSKQLAIDLQAHMQKVYTEMVAQIEAEKAGKAAMK